MLFSNKSIIRAFQPLWFAKASRLFLISVYVFPARLCESRKLANEYNPPGIRWNTDLFVPLKRIPNPPGFPVTTRMSPLPCLLFWTPYVEPSGWKYVLSWAPLKALKKFCRPQLLYPNNITSFLLVIFTLRTIWICHEISSRLKITLSCTSSFKG